MSNIGGPLPVRGARLVGRSHTKAGDKIEVWEGRDGSRAIDIETHDGDEITMDVNEAASLFSAGLRLLAEAGRKTT